MNVTFESFLTPEGVIVAAGLVTGLVQVLKTAIPVLDARVSGALQAFVLTAALYAATALATQPADANGYLAVFAAWLACATSAVGIKSATAHAMTVRGA